MSIPTYETFTEDIEVRFDATFAAFVQHLGGGGSHTIDESMRAAYYEDILKGVADLHDSDSISKLYGDSCELERFPFEVLALDEAELNEAMIYWGYCVGLRGDQWLRHDAYIEEQLQHELEHTAAIHSLGITAVHYGIELLGKGDQVSLRPFVSSKIPEWMTKLLSASITAAPGVLSLGDERSLQAMGYSGKIDVLSRL